MTIVSLFPGQAGLKPRIKELLQSRDAKNALLDVCYSNYEFYFENAYAGATVNQ